MADEPNINTVELATELTIAWLGNQNNRINPEDVPAFLRTMHATVTELINKPGEPAPTPDAEPAPDFTPAVAVRKSLSSKDHILSLIDGKPYKTLRRHLTRHGLTPDDYRERYKLKPDYPMVAENFSQARREVAARIGLGQKGRLARGKSAAVSGLDHQPAAAIPDVPKPGRQRAPAAESSPPAAVEKPKRARPPKTTTA